MGPASDNSQTHSELLPFLSCQPPLSDAIAKRFVTYIQRCLVSNCETVRSVTRYGIWFGRMASPIGCSVQYCCSKYGFTADDISCVLVKRIVEDFIEKADSGVIDKARKLLELIFVRNGSFQVILPCFENDVQFLIFHLSTMCPKLIQRGPGRRPDRKRILVHVEL